MRANTSNADDADVVHAIIRLARSLRLKVLAKGVETEEEMALLRASGRNTIQGYLVSKPLPPEELASLLKGGRSPGGTA